MVATKSSIVDRVVAKERRHGDGVGLTEPDDADVDELGSHLVEVDELRADGLVALEEALITGAFEHRLPVVGFGRGLGRCRGGLRRLIDRRGTRVRFRGWRDLGFGKRPAPRSRGALRRLAREEIGMVDESRLVGWLRFDVGCVGVGFSDGAGLSVSVDVSRARVGVRIGRRELGPEVMRGLCFRRGVGVPSRPPARRRRGQPARRRFRLRALAGTTLTPNG